MSILLPDFLTTGTAVTTPEQPTAVPPSTSEVLSLLGYRDHQIDDHLTASVRTTFAAFELARAVEIVAALRKIDASITEGLESSAIVATCNSQMNWSQHIKMLRQQGHNLLLELGRLYDINLATSKYASYLGRVCVTVQYQ